jgi:hypothetical protein
MHLRTLEGKYLCYTAVDSTSLDTGSSSKLGANWRLPVSLSVRSFQLHVKEGVTPQHGFAASSHLIDSSLSLHELISTSQTTKARLLHV